MRRMTAVLTGCLLIALVGLSTSASASSPTAPRTGRAENYGSKFVCGKGSPLCAEAIDQTTQTTNTSATAATIRPPKPIPSSTPAPPADDLLHITIELTGDSWVSLDADGKSVVSE